jgi:hypothetical protein
MSGRLASSMTAGHLRIVEHKVTGRITADQQTLVDGPPLVHVLARNDDQHGALKPLGRFHHRPAHLGTPRDGR